MGRTKSFCSPHFYHDYHGASDTLHTSHLSSWEGLVEPFTMTWPQFPILPLNSSTIWRKPCCPPSPKPAAGSPRLTFSQILSTDSIFSSPLHLWITRTTKTSEFHWCQWYFSWFIANWVEWELGESSGEGSHTLPFTTPSHWGRRLNSKGSYAYGKGTSSKKKYSYIPKSWLSLSLMHLQPVEFDRKPFSGSI